MTWHVLRPVCISAEIVEVTNNDLPKEIEPLSAYPRMDWVMSVGVYAQSKTETQKSQQKDIKILLIYLPLH